MTKYVVEITVKTDNEARKGDIEAWVKGALKGAHQAIIVPETEGESARITETNVRKVDLD